MLWADIRQVYPNQWLIIEALEARDTLRAETLVREKDVLGVRGR